MVTYGFRLRGTECDIIRTSDGRYYEFIPPALMIAAIREKELWNDSTCEPVQFNDDGTITPFDVSTFASARD